MLPTSPSCSPMLVHEIFRSLLANSTSSNITAMCPEQQTPTTPSPALTAPPRKNTIRFIANDQNNGREKYDGHRWRLLCAWDVYQCRNVFYSRGLCLKHHAERRNKVLPKKKRKQLTHQTSLPILTPQIQIDKNIDEENDIEILEEFCQNPTVRYSTNSIIKPEASDFNVFSVENLNDPDPIVSIKSELKTASYSSMYAPQDIEYITSTSRTNGLNITALISKNLPPLTDFEEEYLASRLLVELPSTCCMLDAQLYLHKEAIGVVKTNYRHKMDAIAPEYFYDFLLRHPRIAIHYKHWFLRSKSQPPATGCPVDMKVWSLGMIVRGATTNNEMNDECEG